MKKCLNLSTAAEPARSELRQGWPLVLASMIGIALGLAPLGTTYTLGPMSDALAAAFGWTRAEIMFATVAATIGLLPASLVIGWVIDRAGVRRVVILSQFGLAICFAALATFTNSLAVFYGLYALMGALAAGTLPIAFAKSITSWFDHRRGLALGLALSGTGLAGFLAPGAVTWMVTEHSWRAAYLMLAALPICIALPLVALWLREPQPSAGAALPAEGQSAVASPFRQWRFWLLAVCFLPVSLSVTGIITNLISILGDHNLTPIVAAGYASLIGLSVIAGRIIVGLLVDRFWAPAVGLIFIGSAAIACVIFAAADAGPVPLIIAICLIGLATGAEIDLNAYLVSRYFEKGAYGKVYAAQYVIIIVGAGIASPIFAAVRDSSGSYAPILMAAAASFIVASFGLLLLGRYPKFAG
jgi:MFS family permease